MPRDWHNVLSIQRSLRRKCQPSPSHTERLGERVAVTGPSGEGKTTLSKIILGLLKPAEGAIFYGGAPVDELGINNVRAIIGAVMQEDALLAGSIRQNISFFRTAPLKPMLPGPLSLLVFMTI
ncbi:ATP-binding cassette domain-containing protein [Massilia atriviolacea]|uniref:ATP-binding cassette domain-containing protein n=1 Tax=Massilia atriviolacea TaxID=2495579 RepID=A0A430HFG7_9BURK|nr:ATP-binding cassette domain-containing protein [Massilia atriviolacea]